ncbi:NEDD8-conjugating enzyme UBC12 [Vairimorpha necatrix]|uniref:NEDD8-conjugating enzyme UBC12 n=1 Tax=Vairimorpha necatrix TaxID=6039 RepID=A0AAX4JET8_9MICR
MPPSFCLFRVKNELSSLVLLDDTSYSVSYVPLHIIYTINMSRGVYKDKSISFSISFPFEYPFVSPKITCLSKIFHPSIDEEGNTCLEMLRLNWRCTYGIQNLFINLYTILIDLECEIPLNEKASKMMREDYDLFLKRAQE